MWPPKRWLSLLKLTGAGIVFLLGHMLSVRKLMAGVLDWTMKTAVRAGGAQKSLLLGPAESCFMAEPQCFIVSLKNPPK